MRSIVGLSLHLFAPGNEDGFDRSAIAFLLGNEHPHPFGVELEIFYETVPRQIRELALEMIVVAFCKTNSQREQ